MATLQKIGESWYCKFSYGGARRTFTIGKVPETEAFQWSTRTDQLLMRISQGLLEVPDGVDIAEFIRLDGKVPVDPELAARKQTRLFQLREAYLSAAGNGALERNTLYTTSIHLDHMQSGLGKHFILSGLTLSRLQAYVAKRGMHVSAVTIKKEIDTFRVVWNWGLRMNWVEKPFPSRGLLYPKTDEKLPFMGFAEITRRIKAGGEASLWECLYLTSHEVGELLTFVQSSLAPQWVYPMVASAAHTGARRSELIRARCEDVDLEHRLLTIREKKRAKGMRTTRRVPISDTLHAALKNQLARQDGRPYLFGPGNNPLSVQSTHKALWRVLRKSKWCVIKGWHVCRHSFISALASKGIDQRIIDDFVGHQTEQQRRRYRHLYPNVAKRALASVFN